MRVIKVPCYLVGDQSIFMDIHMNNEHTELSCYCEQLLLKLSTKRDITMQPGRPQQCGQKRWPGHHCLRMCTDFCKSVHWWLNVAAKNQLPVASASAAFLSCLREERRHEAWLSQKAQCLESSLQWEMITLALAVGTSILSSEISGVPVAPRLKTLASNILMHAVHIQGSVCSYLGYSNANGLDVMSRLHRLLDGLQACQS